MLTTTHDTSFPRSPTSSLSGVELFASAVWYRSKAKLKDILAHDDSDTPEDSHQPHRFPPEIVEMIFVCLIHDTAALKACAATCFTWYNIAIPHLHHTLTLHQWSTETSHKYLNPLTSLYKLGLLPFVKQLQFEKALFGVPWFADALSDSHSVRYFSGLVNLQDLTIADLDFSKFSMGLGQYFGHSSPTLRSVALSCPKGTHRQLLDFFRLFPKLDDIKISYYLTRPDTHVPDAQAIPIRGGLRGRLVLDSFGDEGLLKDMIAAFGGMRFTSMDLQDVRGVQLLLEACADTLEELRIHPDNIHERDFPQRFDFACNAALRSLELPVYPILPPMQDHARTVNETLSTITSPVFSEIVVVFSERQVYHPLERLAWVLREMYEIKRFKVAFCLEALEESRAEKLHHLTLRTKEAAVAGTWDFLSCPPLVFSRTATRYDRFKTSIGDMDE